ncbi:MAG TPA: aminotransferase class IV [Sediminibacterium sp.]|nr:aminotransferase class IV [Sediminibacterium sp.]
MTAAVFLFNDGKFLRSDKPLIAPDNRSFRYGDGFFETMKWCKGNILLEQYHTDRLFRSLETMKFRPPHYFTARYITDAIQQLVKKNGHHELARIRLTIYRGEGGIYDEQHHFPHLLIQSCDLNPANNLLNENGLEIDLYRPAIKSADDFSRIKSNSYLPYVMAAIWAKEQRLNDALLLNAFGNIADATIANLFVVKNGFIKTPPLSDGPVAGAMRQYLIDRLRKLQYEVEESSVSPEDLAGASEVFLTNAIYGIRWVKQFQQNQYCPQLVYGLHKDILLPLFGV